MTLHHRDRICQCRKQALGMLCFTLDWHLSLWLRCERWYWYDIRLYSGTCGDRPDSNWRCEGYVFFIAAAADPESKDVAHELCEKELYTLSTLAPLAPGYPLGELVLV